MLRRVLSDLIRSMTSGPVAPSSRVAQEQAINPFSEFFFNHRGRLIHKWHGYFEIYHQHFARFRGRSPVVVEVGVFHGGSLQMWRDYFGPGARIFGIDIDPRCKAFEDEATAILIGDQSDRRFLAEVRERVPQIDILIDDGGHLMGQQIATFEELYPHIQPHGIYLCEDIHTSFLSDWGGGYRREGTFLEYSKALIDRLYGWYSQEPSRFNIDELTRTTYALHFYDSVLVIEKRPMAPPQQSTTGIPSF